MKKYKTYFKYESPKQTAWDRLSLPAKAEMMKAAVRNGITDLKDIRQKYNEFAEGGGIHIKPENRGKFTALKERTGHSATWFKEHGTPAQKKMAVFALNSKKWKHGDGGNLFYPGGEITYGKPYYSYDENMKKVDGVINYNGNIPEVVVVPDSQLSSEERNYRERQRQKTFDDYDAQRDRELTALQSLKAQREWENSPQKKALDYGIAAAQGIGIGTDIVSTTLGGLPVYSGLKGAQALDRAVSTGDAMDYVEAGLWLSPMLTVGGKKIYDAAKPAIESVFRKGTPAAEWAESAKPVFKSELDWSPESWFGTRATGAYDAEDIAALQSHIPEYLEIERAAKANGTWLKMPDGSTWEGDPRGWAMLQSRAAQAHNPFVFETGVRTQTINPEDNGDLWGVYGEGTAPKTKARTYAFKDDNVLTMFTDSNVPTEEINAEGRHWSNILIGVTSDMYVDDAISRGIKLVKIKNVQDTGPNGVPTSSKYFNRNFLNPFVPQNDIIIPEGQYRKSILGNNGNFSHPTNIYKGIVPGLMLSSYLYEK